MQFKNFQHLNSTVIKGFYSISFFVSIKNIKKRKQTLHEIPNSLSFCNSWPSFHSCPSISLFTYFGGPHLQLIFLVSKSSIFECNRVSVTFLRTIWFYQQQHKQHMFSINTSDLVPPRLEFFWFSSFYQLLLTIEIHIIKKTCFQTPLLYFKETFHGF